MSLDYDFKSEINQFKILHNLLNYVNNRRHFVDVFNTAKKYLDLSTIPFEEFAEYPKNLTPEIIDRIKFLASKLLPDPSLGSVKIYPGGRKILAKNFQAAAFNHIENIDFYTKESFFDASTIVNFPSYNNGVSLLIEDYLLANSIIYPIGNPLTIHLYISYNNIVPSLDELVFNVNPYAALSAYNFMKRYSQYISKIFTCYYQSISNIPSSYGEMLEEAKEEIVLLQQRPLELSEFVNPYGW